MLFVIIGHLLGSVNKQIDNNFIDFGLKAKEVLWVPYYMCTFFILTGFCSNFDMPFKEFIWKSLKTIKMPAIIFGIPYMLGHTLNHGETDPYTILQKVIFSPITSGYWFLDALFISRIIYWIINKYTKTETQKLTITVALLLFGFSIYIYLPILIKFSIPHSLMLVLYLFLGSYLRRNKYTFSKASLCWSGFVYFAMIFAMMYLDGAKVPTLTHTIFIEKKSILTFLILSISGSIFLISLCKSFNIFKGGILYIGQQSLIYYCVHLLILPVIMKLCTRFYNSSILVSFMVFFISLLMILIICTITSRLINTKYLNFIIGKY